MSSFMKTTKLSQLYVISCLSFIQIGFIGLVEEEWLVTLATVDREEVTYLDFVKEGTRLSKELREEVTASYTNFKGSLHVLVYVRWTRLDG